MVPDEPFWNKQTSFARKDMFENIIEVDISSTKPFILKMEAVLFLTQLILSVNIFRYRFISKRDILFLLSCTDKALQIATSFCQIIFTFNGVRIGRLQKVAS